MREQDAAEWRAASIHPPRLLMEAAASVTNAEVSMAIDTEWNPLFFFGLHPDSEVGGAIIWLAGTTQGTRIASRRAKEMMAVMRSWVDEGLRRYGRLHNVTDVRNTVHHRWLKALGFTFTEYIPHFGPQRLPFWRFEIRKEQT